MNSPNKPSSIPAEEILAAIKGIISDFGLKLIGVCPADSYPLQDGLYQKWLDKGNAGSMDFMRQHAPLKYHPQAVLPECKSLIFVALNYFQAPPDLNADQGIVARYAWGRDYHKVLGKKLLACRRALEAKFPNHQWRNFTDTCPIDERWYAEKAGISFTGRNHLAISQEFGSWFVMGEILSTLELPTSGAASPKTIGVCPSGCKRCIDVCPTGALKTNGSIDVSQCIAYLTIEHKGPFPIELRKAMGQHLFGCDKCQEVCPHNLRATDTSEPDFLRWKAGPAINLAELLGMNEADFLERFAGGPLMRAGYKLMLRNALNAAGNSKNPELIPAISAFIAHADPLLAEQAVWALNQLQSPNI